jgi:hypothetical protein
MSSRNQEDLIREAVREILAQEGFLGDLWSGIKTGTGKVYDFVAGALGAEEPKSGFFKTLDDLSPDIPTQKSGDFFTQIFGSDNSQDDEFEQDDSSGLEESPIEGVMQKPGVTWTDATLEFVEKMRAILDSEIPMTITSAARTEREQANAMFKKWQLGGDDELRRIYGGKADAFISSPKNPEAWEQIIRDRNSRKQSTSPHMRGVAVDVRTRDLSSLQIDALVAAARAAGGKTLLEDTPPHLHIDGFAESSGQLYT